MMKKRKLIQMVLCVVFAMLLLCGCGNSKEKSPVSEAGTEVEAEAAAEGVGETTDAQTAGDAGKADETDGADVSGKADEADKAEAEDGQAEEYKGMPVATVATTVSDIDEFCDYAEKLDDPAILIYNENEGYVINMGEGEYYQLKKDDRIFEWWSNNGTVKVRTDLYASSGKSFLIPNLLEAVLEDEGENASPQKVDYVAFFSEKEYDGDYFLMTCYLDAPKE